MKKVTLMAAIISVALFSCKKEDDSRGSNSGNATVTFGTITDAGTTILLP